MASRNNITSKTYNGQTIAYSYDSRNRMTGTTGGGVTATYAYDAANNLTQTTAGGQSTAYTYNKNNAATSISIGTAEGTTTIAYAYDAAGRVTSKTRGGLETTYTYDAAGRLSQAAMPGKSVAYAYDAAGNRTEMTEQTTTARTYTDTAAGEAIAYSKKITQYEYFSTNELAKTTAVLYNEDIETARLMTTNSYNPDGSLYSSLTALVRPGIMADGGQLTVGTASSAAVNLTEYRYDAFGRQQSVTVTKGTDVTETTYTYNGDGLRTSRSVTNASGSSQTVNYILDGANVAAQTGARSVTYVSGAAGYVGQAENGAAMYYRANAHGDVVLVTDANGAVKNSYEYDAFGEAVAAVETVAVDVRYAGEFYDSSTGQYYLRARYYDPGTGRFTSEDTYRGDVANPSTLNLYVYCGNDPVNYVDPSGHTSTTDDEMWDYYIAASYDYTEQYIKQYTSEADGTEQEQMAVVFANLQRREQALLPGEDSVRGNKLIYQNEDQTKTVMTAIQIGEDEEDQTLNGKNYYVHKEDIENTFGIKITTRTETYEKDGELYEKVVVIAETENGAVELDSKSMTLGEAGYVSVNEFIDKVLGETAFMADTFDDDRTVVIAAVPNQQLGAAAQIVQVGKYVMMRAFFDYQGDAKDIFPDADANGKSFEELFSEGVKEQWSGEKDVTEYDDFGEDEKGNKYDKIQVKMKVYSKGEIANNAAIKSSPSDPTGKAGSWVTQKYVKVTFYNNPDEKGYKKDPPGIYGDRHPITYWGHQDGPNPWTIDQQVDPEGIHMVLVDGRDTNIVYDVDWFKKTSGHEVGHMFGLGDAYGEPGYRPGVPDSNPEVGNTIMNYNDPANANDIEMVLRAFETNQFQEFHDYMFVNGYGRQYQHYRSDVIRSNYIYTDPNDQLY